MPTCVDACTRPRMAGKWAPAASTCTRVGRVAVIRTFSSKQAQVKQCGPGAGQEHAGLAEAEGRGLIAEKACAGFLKLSSRVGGPSSALGLTTGRRGGSLGAPASGASERSCGWSCFAHAPCRGRIPERRRRRVSGGSSVAGHHKDWTKHRRYSPRASNPGIKWHGI